MRVLLTSSRAPATLELARRFHAHGDDVYVGDCLRFGCGNFSRSIAGKFLTPRPNAGVAHYLAALNKIIKQEKIELLIPTCEEIFCLARYRDRLDCEVFADSFATLRDIHDKWTFSQTASNAAGKVPESFLIGSQSQLSEFRDRSNEFVFKPVFSRFASETLIQPTDRQLLDLAVSEKKPWIAQRYVAGKEYSTFSIARQGQLVLHCTYRSSFRAGIGSGICFQVEPNDSLTSYAANFVKQHNFTGQIGLDCIIGEAGEIWVLEGNPRSTSGLHLFDNDSSVVNAILGNGDGLIEATRGRSKMVGVAMLSFGFHDALTRRNLLRYFRELVTSKDVLFRWSDPVPTLGLPITIGELCWVAMGERKTLQQASTSGIEWNGEPL